MSDYPIPSYAASIWLVGDTIWLGFPPLGDGVQSHSAPFPANERGLALLLSTLRERGRGSLNIGLKGSPTRYQIERQLVQDAKYNGLLKAMKEAKAKQDEEKEKAIAFLKELGL